MAFSYYLNMEKLSLEIAKEHLKKMTDDNYVCYADFIDENKFINNIKNGFVVITQLDCLIESLLNTIMYRWLHIEDRKKLRLNIDKKLGCIFKNNEAFCDIKESDNYKLFLKTKKIRNEMIHWKKNYYGNSTTIAEIEIEDEKLSSFFTKQKMKHVITAHEDLCITIAYSLDLRIHNEVEIIEAEGRDGLVNFIFDPKQIDIDHGRFE